MSFLLGLLIGAVVFNDGTPVDRAYLEKIPIRCLGLVENDLAAYKECRRPSLQQELENTGGLKRCHEIFSGRQDCINEGLMKNLDWEISSLQQMAKIAQQKGTIKSHD